MKKNATVEELATKAVVDGVVKKGQYSVERDGAVVSLLLKDKVLAKFEMTGYETGNVLSQDASTKAQETAVETFIAHFTGK
jgi:hypothetical protein